MRKRLAAVLFFVSLRAVRGAIFSFAPSKLWVAGSNPAGRAFRQALALAALLGPFGAHRFYVGKTGTGLLMLCTLSGAGLWYLYDLLLERMDFAERFLAESRTDDSRARSALKS